MNTQKNIQIWITDWLFKQGLTTDFTISLLLGDGSSRSFYRITTPTQSYILVSDPQWSQTQDYPVHQDYLKNSGLSVPEFFCNSPLQGFLLMQDLGDELLQFRIAKNKEGALSWLEKAAILLADLHGKTFPVPQKLPVAQRFFDADKYFSELLFTFEFLHQKLLNQPALSADQERAIKDFCAVISQFSPSVFSHRDYHCRNLIIFKEKLVMIDFQDARMGSPQYDLASLVYDAYQPLSENERSKLIRAYKTQVSKYPVAQKIDWDTFETNLKQVAFQRTLKAAGSFASFFIRYGKATHWPYLVPALTSAYQLQKEGYGVNSSAIDIEKWIALVSQIKIQ